MPRPIAPTEPSLPAGIELRYLRAFVAVAEELHFGRAASRLGIAQPPLSHQIARLERIVGHPLLERKPRVLLTEPGRVLLGAARRVLAQVAHGVESTRRAARGESGAIVVGFAASTMLTRVPEVFRAFRARHAGVELFLRELSSAAQLDALASGAIDVGFLREPPDDPALEATVVMREPYRVVLPPGHALAKRKRIALASLEAEPFILFPRNVAPALYDQVLGLCRAAGVEPRRVQEAQEWLTIVGLVDAGLGVSIVPASFERLRWGRVTYHAISPTGEATTIAMCRRREEPTPVVSAFVGTAAEVLGG